MHEVTSLASTGPAPIQLSASQISSWRDCKRKWGFRYLDGVKEPPHPSAALGTAVHSHAEKFLRDGTMPDVLEVAKIGGKEHRPGMLAAQLLPHLPQTRQPKEWVEHKWQLVVRDAYGDITYIGYIDLFSPPASLISVNPLAWDHKTTSDFRYAKSPEDLLSDPQAVLYAKYLLDFHDTNGTGVAELRWNYVRTKPPHKVRPVFATITRAQIEAAMLGINDDARQMLAAHASRKRALELAPTASACEKYGGCPHRNIRCRLTNEERLESIMSAHSLREKLTSAAPTAPDPALLRASQDGWLVHPKDATYWYKGQEVIAATELATRYVPPAPPPPPALPPVPTPPLPVAPTSLGMASPGINPPESHLPPIEKIMVGGQEVSIEPAPPLAGPGGAPPSDDVKDMFTGMSRDELKQYALEHHVQHPAKAREATIRDIIRADLKRRGIPYEGMPEIEEEDPFEAAGIIPPDQTTIDAVQSEVAALAAANARIAARATPTPVPPPQAVLVEPPFPGIPSHSEIEAQGSWRGNAQTPSEVASCTDTGAEGFTLYVNCTPTKGGDRPLSFLKVFGDILKGVAEANGKIHYKEIGFGKGPGLVAAAIQEAGTSAPAIYIDSMSAEGRDFLAMLEEMAGTVVRGIS